MITKNLKRRSSFLVLVLLLVGTMWVAGCGGNIKETPAPKPGQIETTTLSGTITIAGSTSVQPFSEALAEEFMDQNQGVIINVQGGGSSVGIESAISVMAAIGAISRDVKDAEKAKATLVETAIALDGMALVVHPENAVKNLTTEQVRNIYTGNIKNWNELGGTDGAIAVVSREEGSGTREAFLEMVMDDNDILNAALILNSTGAIRTTVASNKNAIGYISLAILNDEVQALEIDGVAANEANIKAGTYKIQRPFLYVTKDEPTGLAKAFIEFILSDAGQRIVVEEGAIGVK